MDTTEMRPLLAVGDRVFSHYTMKWGTITRQGKPEQVRVRGVETDEWDTWHNVEWDDGTTDLMNDGGSGGWVMARVFPPNVAKLNGYGDDPREPNVA